jgi:UbiD family decarboxylase
VCQFFFDAAAFPPISWQFRVEGDQSRSASPALGKDINLFDLMPLFRLNRGDGASTSTTWRMSGVYRLMVKGPNRIGIQTMPQRDISVQLAR